ncbi:uncharacterized protein TRIVIDRAFT_149892 [Trichoderma virens Gv29-8]|uniref:Uncharacterized protein n=1 Tax=Hypocrea virens (strain Gv29-8 / FGSC 10586) TaxID=413071 RepID=G9MSD0_HYPVG|nr:uncharacterized protein TRIVIDRAFT_149892 [Trichoderma virens Gv29-8]EHK22147.1 hypothetical protein TRIVIDRAFT_149892 [Trichoderma virens Gv29-8]
MAPDLKALFQRVAATADPTSVTRAERNQIYRLPPPDEEDRLCKEKTGFTMDELKKKAMADPETLTEVETFIIILGATHDVHIPGSGSSTLLWKMGLVDDEHQLARQVHHLLSNEYDIEVHRRAQKRARAFDDVKKARKAQKRQELVAAQAARIRASRPQWVNHMFDAQLPQWGFVIFRTAYSEGTDEKWRVFNGIFGTTVIQVFHKHWRIAASLSSTHVPIAVSDPLLEAADLETLRQRFKAMRERNEIPNRIATDCLLVADRAGPSEPDPWQNTLFLRAVNPDYDASAPNPSDEDLSGYEGVITIPLPKAVDWLYYCFFANSEDWETRYKVVKGGAAEQMVSTGSICFLN